MIQWTPSTSGNYDVTVNASNGVTPDAEQTFTLAVSDPLTLPASLVSYWKLDETVSGNFFDSKGTNDGTGTTTPVAGQVNGAQQFNGTTDKIEVPADPAFDFAASDDFSVEFWCKIDAVSSNYRVAVGRHITSTNRWFIGIPYNYQTMVLYLQSGADDIYLNGNIPVIDGLWHHIAATRNGTTGETKLYVDGVLGGSKTKLFSSDFSSPSAKLEIGSYLNTYRFDGNLDEIAIFNNELNLTEINTHFTNGNLGYFTPSAPSVTSIPLTTGVTGELYSYDVNAAGYPAPTYSLTSFPAGMTIDPNYRIDSMDSFCIPGNYDVTVEAS